jgi:pimeloyl-ACP methyl ester carboxylesterase
MDKYYRKVPPEVRENFMRFRQEHPVTQREIDGIPWEYIRSGDPSGQPLMLLPGGLGIAESGWRMISRLDHKKYSILSPSYPGQISTMTALADGISKIITLEGIQTSFLIGGAYGSMLAQVFIRRHADLVSRLVLTHAYPPVASRVKSVNPTLRLFRYLPMFMVKSIMRTAMTGRLPHNPPAELLLIAAQIRETLDARLTRQTALSTYLRMVDFDKQNFTYTDLDTWQGKTLIILAEDDTTTTEELRNVMLALYPGAILHLLKGNIEAAALLETSEYIRVMEAFFEDKIITPAENPESAENPEGGEK